MRVEQQQQGNNIIELLQQSTGIEEAGIEQPFGKSIAAATSSSNTGSKSVNMKDATYLKPGTEEKKTAAEELEEDSAIAATERKNQMTVLSNTTSKEDYAKMQEDGFSLETTTTNTIVTVTDKIKAQLAKAGVDISCFGDDLDLSQMEEITGSVELAAQLASALHKMDLPFTEENIKDTIEALDMAKSLETPGDGAMKYMLDNHLKPTIENLYKAEYSGSASYRQGPGIDISSFTGQIEDVIQQAGLKVNEQTMSDSKWLLENDIPLTGENLKAMEAMREIKTPLDQENLVSAAAAAISEGRRPQEAMLLSGYSLAEQAQHILDVVTEATGEDVQYLVDRDMELTVKNLESAAANRLTAAVSGTETDTGVLKETDEAAKTVSSQTTSQNTQFKETEEYTPSGLATLMARRQLEEVRLAMTAQANYSLLKQGISIDTEPLVKLVEDLKQAENDYYIHLLKGQGAEPTEENVALFRETTQKVADIKYVPAYVLGLKEADISTVNAVHESGMELKETFEKANERYEKLMTNPREDLGDSIQEAFRSVDNILEDIGMKATEANRRAVRILGYNQLEITKDSVAQMKAADEEVQRAFKNLTPAVVTEMIKKGVNPLNLDFSTLNAAAEQIKENIGDDNSRKYSEYLWKLEKNQAIDEEERSSYIGIYRLVHQVESTDGAAIGALVHQGGELTMKNLLTAVRSERRSGRMDIAVDDTLGKAESTGYGGTSITDQIEASYQKNCAKDVKDILTPEKVRAMLKQTPDWESMTPEQLKESLERVQTDETDVDEAYMKEQLAALEESAKAGEDIYHVLQKYDIPNTVNNIIAMQSMVKDRNQIYRQIFGGNTKEEDETGDVDEVGAEDIEQIKKKLLEEFAEAVSEPKALAEVQEKLGILAENVMKGMIDSDHVTSLDVREMRLLSAKLSVNGILAKKEQYSVPVMVKEGVVNVSLKIVRGVDKKGVVDIMMETEMRGKIAATFQAKEDSISGFVATDNRDTKDLLSENTEVLEDWMSENGEENADVHYAYINKLDLNHFSMGIFGVDADSATEENRESESYRVQTTRLYHIAENFIRQIKEIL